MEHAITLYKELCYIETYDGDVIALADDFKVIAEQLNNANRFMDL
jgi:hypothetical protein